MAPRRRRLPALWLFVSFGLSSTAFADASPGGDSRQPGYASAGAADVAHHLNSFAMIFGRCVWIPPSPEAAFAAFSLFFGIDTRTQPDAAAAEAVIVGQYVVSGKSRPEADKELAWLNTCFATYEVPPENSSHAAEPGPAPQQVQKPAGK
jgi:hypothetical protein